MIFTFIFFYLFFRLVYVIILYNEDIGFFLNDNDVDSFDGVKDFFQLIFELIIVYPKSLVSDKTF